MRFNLERLGPIVSDPQGSHLGELAVERGWITGEQLRAVVERQRSDRKPLAELLVDHAGLTPEQVEELRGQLAPATRDLSAEAKVAAADPARRVGQYVLLEVVGGGGAAVVWKAWQPDLGRAVALKILRPGEHSETFLRRFADEGKVMASLSHPHIVQVYEVGESPRGRHIAMEFVEGRMPARQDFDDASIARLVRDVATGVAYAHSRGIIHRDIKPSNIVVRKDGHAFIMDFGLAKRFDEELGLTRSGTVLGTPHYMAPEQASGRLREVDARSDVYSLGATLYELLTGTAPFSSADETLASVIHRVIQDEPMAPRRLRHGLPPDLETIIQKAMDKAKERRYDSASEFADDLTRFLAGEPVRASKASLHRVVWRKVQRNRAASAAVACALVALLLLAFSQVRGYLGRMEREREEVRYWRSYAEVQQAADRLVTYSAAMHSAADLQADRDLCAAILVRFPRMHEARLLKAEFHAQLMERPAALREFEEAVKDEGRRLRALRGSALVHLSITLDALLMRARGLPLHPGARRHLEQARTDLELVVRELKPGEPEMQGRGGLEALLKSSMDLLERALTIEPEKLHQSLLEAHKVANRGPLRLDDGLLRNIEARSNVLMNLLQGACGDGTAAWKPAAARMRQGLVEELARQRDPLPIYTDVVEKRPAYESAYVFRGLLLLERGERAKALADFRRAIELDLELADVLAEKMRAASLK